MVLQSITLALILDESFILEYFSRDGFPAPLLMLLCIVRNPRGFQLHMYDKVMGLGWPLP